MARKSLLEELDEKYGVERDPHEYTREGGAFGADYGGYTFDDEGNAYMTDYVARAEALRRLTAQVNPSSSIGSALSYASSKLKNASNGSSAIGKAALEAAATQSMGFADRVKSWLGDLAGPKNVRISQNESAFAKGLRSASSHEGIVYTTDEREELMEEFKRLNRQSAVNSIPKQRRMDEIRARLEEIDRELGNPQMDYGFSDRTAGTVGGSAAEWLGNQMYQLGELGRIGTKLSEKLGGNTSDYAGWATDEVSAANIGTENDQKKREQQLADATKLREIGRAVTKYGQSQTEKAKAGTGKLAGFALDVAGNYTQAAMDRLAGPLSLLSLGSRASAGAMIKAEEENPNITDRQKWKYGYGVGTVEMGSEKAFGGLSKLYGKGLGDDLIEKAIRHAIKNDTVRGIALFLADQGEEAVEEFISNIAEPYLATYYTGQSAKESYKERFDAGETLYDMLVGWAMGGLGGGMKAISGDYAATKKKMGLADSAESALKEKGWPRKQASTYGEIIAKQFAGEELSAKEQALMDKRPTTQEVMTDLAKGEYKKAAAADHALEGKKKEKLETNLTEFFENKLGIEADGETKKTVAVELKNEFEMNPQMDSGTFALAAREVFTFGNEGLTLAEAKGVAQLGGELTDTSFEHIWRMGALQRLGVVDKNTSEGRKAVLSHLAWAGDNAGRIADAHEATQLPEKYGAAMNKAINLFAAHDADLQTVVDEVNREGSQAKWAQDRDLGMLTPEQIRLAQEIGREVKAERQQRIRQQAEALEQAVQKATGATTLKQVNRQLSAVRNVLTKAEADLKAAEAEMRQMRDSGAWSENEEAYQEVVRRVENLDRIIEKGKKAEADLEARRAEAQKKAPEKRKKGTITYDESVDRNNLTREQKRAVATVQALADAVNIDYVLFAGKEGQGGSYQDGMMRVNINAALDGRNIVGAVLSHELTHHLQRFAPKEYEALRDFVIEKIKAEKGERGFSRLVQDQMRLEKGVKALSYDQAVDELVANSCVTMLADSKTVTELARKNMDLAEKIADFIADFAVKIKAAFEDVDIHSDSSLFGAARAMEKYFGDLQKLWDNALKAADVNYNALQGETVQSGETQAMAWDNPDIDRTFIDFNDAQAMDAAIQARFSDLVSRGKTVSFTKEEVAAMASAVDWADNKAGRKYFKKLLREALGTDSVFFEYEGSRLEAYLTGKGIDHSAKGAFTAQRGVMASAMRKLIINSEYAFSSKHDQHSVAGSTIEEEAEWDYFVAAADFDGDYVPAVFDIRTIDSDERSQIYSIATNKEALTRGAAPNHGPGHPSYGSSASSGNSVPNTGAPVKQGFTSAKTSINSKKIPVLYTDRNAEFVNGGTNIDIGGGRFDTATDYLKNEKGTTNMIFDPYNRSEEHNAATLKFLQDGNKADTATCSNVLNVIDSPEARANVILETAKAIKPDGKAYFTVYEGDGSGNSRETSSGWQENRKTESYVPEIRLCFEQAERKGKLIIAEKPKQNLPRAVWETSPGNATMYMSWDGAEERAVEHFGKTWNFNEAGYILQDGSMLDFSGKKFGGPSNTRTIDHREIRDVLDEDFEGSMTDALIGFMQRGNIRLLNETGGINLAQKPTAQQRSRLESFIQKHRGYIYVDFDDARGNTVASASYEAGTRSSKILNEIDAYYDYGELPESSANDGWFMTWEGQMTLDDLSEGEFSAKAGSEEALAEGLTNQAKKLLVGYTPEGWDGPITAEEIDDWMEPNYYRRRTENLFSESMLVMDNLYQLAIADPKNKNAAFKLMEQIANTMNPLLQQYYTLADSGRAAAFSEYWDKRHPSLYYPGYEAGDLFLGKGATDDEYLVKHRNLLNEIDYLNGMIDERGLAPETVAEMRELLDRLTAPTKRWETLDPTIDKRINPGQMRRYEEVFYMSWDNDHNDWAPEFYSKLNRTVMEWTNEKGRPMPEKMAANAVIPWLRGRGVKAEEIRWSGLQPWLEGKKSVMKDEVAAYLAGNMVKIDTEVLKTKGENQYFVGGTEGPGAYFDSMEQALEHCRQTAKKSFGDKVEVNPVTRGEQTHVRVEDEGRILAVYYIDSPENVYPDPGDTHWFDEKMDGGTNYREILFRLPGSNYHNQAMRLHWNRSGILAHARVQDMEEVSNGKRVLFVEEMQSDWHNAGAKKDKKTGGSAGFSSGENNAIYDRLAGLNEELRTVGNEAPEYTEVAKFVATLRKRILDEENLRKYWYGLPEYQLKNWIEKPGEDILDSFFRSDDYEADNREAEKLVMGLLSEEETAFIENCRYAYQRTKELRAEETKLLTEAGDTPPDAPFAGSADTYHEYVMKHLLRLAAEGDYDSIAWTTAEQQVKRWPDPDLERRIRNFKAYQIEYDQTIPSFMKKYTKQWGGKVSDMALAVPYTRGQETRVWSVDITPEMKKAVLHEGQPLFMSWEGMEDTDAEWEARLEAYSRLASEQAIQDEVFGSIRELTRSEKRSLKEIQDRLKIGKTPEARIDDAQKAARDLIRKYSSKMDEAELTGEILHIWNYVLNEQDPSGTVARNMASELAERIADSAKVTVEDETESDTLKEIRGRIQGAKLVISADETGDIPGYQNLTEFRKKNFGRFTVAGKNSGNVTTEHTAVDSLYEELRNDYGDYYFPEMTNQGEMLGVLAGYFDATEQQTVNPFEGNFGEAVESIANEIVRSAWWDALRLQPLSETEKVQVRNADARERLQELNAQRKITKKDVGLLEAPIEGEEQQMALNEQLKAQVRALVEAGELSKAEAADLQAKLLRMNSRVKTLEDQYDLLEEQAEKRVAQAREEGAAKAAEQIAKIRERNAKNVQALKDHFQEVQKNARGRREESANVRKYRDQVTEKAQKLYELLIKNDDKKHVPEVLKAPLAEFLEELDFTSKRQLRGGPETKKDQAFAARLMQLERMLSNQQRYIDGDQTVQSDLGGYIDISPDNLEYLRNMAEAVNRALTRGQTYTINDMSGAQLKDLSKLLSNLYTAINKMNRFMANARYDTIRDAASGDIDYLDSLGEAKDTAEGFLNRFLYWKDGVPYYVFNRFGEGGKSIFDGFTRGWEKLAFHAQEIINFTEALYTDKEVAAWTKDLHEFTLQDGSKIKMTTAQVMELSMLLNREQARKHIFKGGVRIGTVRYKEKGKTLTRNDTNHYHLTQADIENLVGSLTARQAEVARGLQRFMAEKGEEWGNEISMRRFGYNFYTEGANYYPIKTDPSDRPMSDTDTPQNASMFRLLNLSSSKALNPKASNALIIGDIFDTFANHTSDMAKLNAMGLPVLDAIKWFNYKERVNIDSFTGEHTTRTVQRAMERAYGKQAGHYFRTLMKDINGVVEAGDRGADIWSNLTARYKAVAVGANLRVALLQPTSYLRALNVIDGKYLAAAFAHRNAYKEAMEYSGTAVWKSMGYYDTDISKGMRGQIKHDDSWKDKVVEASMKMAEIGDKRTWGRLWVACKLKAKAQNPGLQGEELKAATADLFRKVIYSSQVMDSTLTRSEMMRSKSIGDKLLTPFMAEPTLSFNILMDAYSGYTLDERRMGKAEAWKKNAGKIGRAFTAYVATAAFNALAESIWDAVRDDDDEEFWEKFRQALFGEEKILDGNLVSDLLISNKIPGVKDVISLLQGYDSGNIATEGITNLVNVFNMWKETYLLSTGALEKATKLTYYGRMTEWGKIYKSLQAISQLSGLPIYSATREAVAIWNTLMNGRKDEWKILTYDGNQLSDSALEGYETYVRDTGISQKQYKKIMGDADADGTVNPKQDELGEYLMGALADGAITEEQAAALWNSRGWSDKHDFNWWRDKNADIEKVEEQLGMTVEESIQQAEEKLKAEATPAPEKDQLPEPTPTPTPTPSATPKAEKPKTEVKVDKVTDYEGFKKAVPLYKEEQRKASYEVWENSLKGTLPLERYVEILQKADTDNNDSLKQEELGWALVDAVKNNDMNQDQAGEVWAAQGWSAKHDFQWWLQKNYS